MLVVAPIAGIDDERGQIFKPSLEIHLHIFLLTLFPLSLLALAVHTLSNIEKIIHIITISNLSGKCKSLHGIVGKKPVNAIIPMIKINIISLATANTTTTNTTTAIIVANEPTTTITSSISIIVVTTEKLVVVAFFVFVAGAGIVDDVEGLRGRSSGR